MPNYTFRCEVGHERVVNVPIKRRNRERDCEDCYQSGWFGKMHRVPDAPAVHPHVTPRFYR